MANTGGFGPRVRRRLRGLPLGALALCLLLPAAGLGASFEADVDLIDARAVEIASRTGDLEDESRPGAYLSDAEAVTRFQDTLFLHLVGEHGPAAEGFFALVTTGALTDSGLHRDAEWYLAESLVGLENYKTAATRFQVIVDDPEHPFRDDAVRRLLELHARAGDAEAFQALYDAEIVPGKVKPTGLITYSLAKSFYTQGELADAKRYFAEVPDDNAWYGRARYFLGTIGVKEGDLDGAIEHFEAVTALSVQTTEDRLVLDLSLLALGRIHYHLEDYFQASEYYNRIGGDSRYQADKLYELSWTSIRREKWRDALNFVEIFLLSFPEHEYAAQLELLQGHLNFQEANWTDALESYEQVIIDYTPVRQRFAALSMPGSSAEAEMRQVIETSDGAGDLPPYAVAMMRNDPELGRAMGVFRDLEQERSDIETSERMIGELRSIIQGSGSMSTYEDLRIEALEMRSEVLRRRIELMLAHGRWLETLPNVDKAKVSDLEARRAALEASLGGFDGQLASARSALETYEQRVAELRAEADNVRREAQSTERDLHVLRGDLKAAAGLEAAERERILSDVATLEVDLSDARARLTDIDQQLASLTVPHVLDAVDVGATNDLHGQVSALAAEFRAARPAGPGLVFGDRIDSVDQSLADSYDRLEQAIRAVARVEQSQLGRIQQSFEHEVGEVAKQRADHAATLASAREVSAELTRDGFGRLEDFFADSVLKADMGIVDVYWAQKLEVDDELTRVKEEKDELLADLEQRFRLIREKLGEPR